MSTERLKILHKQEQNQRKFVCVMNDVAKTQQLLYEGYIDKEKHEAEQKSDKSIVMTRRNIVRQRVLKECMKNKREDVERSNAKKIFGQYNGEQVEHIASGIDTYLERNHPKIRRRKKVEQLFEEGYRKGAILDNRTVHAKVNEYFERPLIRFPDIPERNDTRKNNKFPALTRSFYTGNFQCSQHSPVDEKQKDYPKHSSDTGVEAPEILFVKRKVSKFLNEDVPDDVSVQSETPPVIFHESKGRGIRPLTLPPIKIGTDNYVVPPRKSKDCISELINRLHKAKSDRDKEKKQKKERRAKRLQHERVFGVGHSSEINDVHGSPSNANLKYEAGKSMISDTGVSTWPTNDINTASEKPLRLPRIN